MAQVALDRRRRLFLAGVIAVVGLAVLLPLAWPSLEGALQPGAQAPPPVTVPANVAAGAYAGHHLASPFYAVVFTVANHTTSSLVSTGRYLNSTPLSWFRFGGSGKSYDPTTATDWLPPTTGGKYQAEHIQLWNFSWFESWCASRPDGCRWLGYLPGEMNNTAAAVHAAEWYHSVLGFSPQYWQFGNEPELWTHFGKNYSAWSTTDALVPSSIGYATMVHNYIAAIAPLYPQDRFVGIEAACSICFPSLVSATATLDGANLSGMAYHSYPAGVGSSTDLSQFYSTLNGAENLTTTSSGFRGLYAPTCPACGSLPLQIGEYQAGPPTNWSPFSSQYAGAVFLAGAVVQALESNVSMFTVYDTGALFNASGNIVTPEGLLYQRILANMTMGDDYRVQLSAPGLGGVYSVLVRNQSREALLLVNANTATTLNLTLPASGFPAGSVGSEWAWSPSLPVPLAERQLLLGYSYQVPPQGILLLTNY